MKSTLLYGGIFLVGLSLGTVLRGHLCDADELVRVLAEKEAYQKALDERDLKAQHSHERAMRLESEIAALRKIKVKIDESPIYNSCIVPDSGMQSIHEAIRTANTR